MIRLDPDVDDLLVAACKGRSINTWVTDAIVVRLSSWEHPLEKIKGKRKAAGRSDASVFDLAKFHALGFPLGQLIPSNPRAEVGQALRKGPDAVRALLKDYWLWNELDPAEYTDAMLAETIRVYNASKGGSA